MNLTCFKSVVKDHLLYVILVFGMANLLSLEGVAQTKKVLFVGNSYTYYNNLPQLVANIALTTGDTLVVDEITQGGARLMDHAANAQVYAKMHAQDWTYVVLQAQSQEPSWPIQQVQTDVFPYATQLSDSIHALSTCAIPVFFMTWGRKNGDQHNCANWPPVCTYEGMDSLLNERYQTMGADNDALVSPVGAVWRHIRQNYPNIDLYTTDGSHPSAEGSYAAAVTFYTIFTQKDPTFTTDVTSIDAQQAAQIRDAAKAVVFDDLAQWNVMDYNATSDFTHMHNSDTVWFTNTSTNWESLMWDFGDGNTSTQENPQHVYGSFGNYTATLFVQGCYNMDTTEVVISLVNSVKNIDKKNLTVWPNPVIDVLHFSSSANLLDASYQVFNVAGLQMKEGALVMNQINLSGLPQGLYLIQLQTVGNETYILKVTKD